MAPLLVVEHGESHAFCASRFSEPLRQELPEDLPKRRRRVLFGGTSVIHREAESVEEAQANHERKWFTADELQSIRQEAKAMSSDLRSKGAANASSCFVTLAHRKTTLILSSDFKSLTKLSKSTPDQDLHQWCSWDDGRRGLERFSSQSYWVFRRRDISFFRESVMEESRRQQESGCHDPEAIAKVAREASRRSRTFALFMGEADALEANGVHLEATPRFRRAPPSLRQAPPHKRSRMEH